MEESVVGLCREEGCERLRMFKSYGVNRRKYYRGVCAWHWRHKRHCVGVSTVQCPCEWCRWEGQLHRHRKIPGAEGGSYQQNNLEWLCPNCHAAVHGDGDINQRQI